MELIMIEVTLREIERTEIEKLVNRINIDFENGIFSGENFDYALDLIYNDNDSDNGLSKLLKKHAKKILACKEELQKNLWAKLQRHVSIEKDLYGADESIEKIWVVKRYIDTIHLLS